jgi:hypothetical protein
MVPDHLGGPFSKVLEVRLKEGFCPFDDIAYISHWFPSSRVTLYLNITTRGQPQLTIDRKNTLLWMIGCRFVYRLVTKPMPWTRGNLMLELEAALGCKFAFTENASSVSDVRTVLFPNSIADSMMDWIPMGLMKYCTGDPGTLLFGGPYAL